MELTNELIKLYKELLNGVYRYRFDYQNRKSYGYKQNMTNINMLSEITMFKPFVEIVKDDIDLCLKNDINDNYKNYLINKINKIINDLKLALYNLYNKEYIYHATWNKAMRSEYYGEYATMNELGKTKVAWKKEKNNACHTLLSFYKELFNIYVILPIHSNTDKNVNALYNISLCNIINGPNYYSYLLDDEKSKLTKQNKIKKYHR